MERLIAGITLGLAFLVMASIFVPERTHAGGETGHETPAGSTDPHQGLRSLGTLEDDCYRVTIYATTHGPRFSVSDRYEGRELGALLTADQVGRYFPDLLLPGMDFSAPMHLMLVDPDAARMPGH